MAASICTRDVAIAAARKMRTPSWRRPPGGDQPGHKDSERYWAEPYVLPGNVDGPDSPHFGRAGWTWYTGSASWLYRVATQWVLGVRPEWDGLRVDPCLPPEWDSVRMTRPWRGSTYRFEITRTNPGSARPAEITLDGRALPGNLIPPPGDRATHEVKVRI